MISINRLRECLDYDPKTGIFRCLIRRGVGPSLVVPGQIVGTIGGGSDGQYLLIGVDGKKYYAHRLAWYYIYGRWPLQLDHKDLNKQNNSIDNLREASTRQNAANTGARPTNHLGVKGIRRRTKNCYEARITVLGNEMVVGYFKTLEEAKLAYALGMSKIYGEFARAE